MKKIKQKGCFILIALLFFSLIPFSKGEAATFEEMNRSHVFLKQKTGYTCTLASATMLVRRTLLVRNNKKWDNVTETSMRKTAWAEGAGLYHHFTYAGVTVDHTKLPEKGIARKNKLIRLLKKHPEGIVIYDRGLPHAILLTDYTNGKFYCADPANNYPSGRINITSTRLSVNSIDDYWYVESPSTEGKLSASKEKEDKTDNIQKEEETNQVADQTLTVKVPKVKQLSVKGKRKALVIRWKKRNCNYQIQYSRSKTFKKSVKINIKNAKQTKLICSKLKSDKTYYVRVRNYRKVNGKKYRSPWAEVKKVIIK